MLLGVRGFGVPLETPPTRPIIGHRQNKKTHKPLKIPKYLGFPVALTAILQPPKTRHVGAGWGVSTPAADTSEKSEQPENEPNTTTPDDA